MKKFTKNNIEISVEINPFEIRSIKFNNVETCYQQDAGWNKNWPFLFPIVGSLRDGEYTHEGKKYNLSRHGFFRDIDGWEVESETEDTIIFVVRSNNRYINLYPWEFEIRQIIKIVDDTVNICMEVTNIDSTDMYFSMGYHPAFIRDENTLMEFDVEQNFNRDMFDGLFPREPKEQTTLKSFRMNDIDFENEGLYWTDQLKAKKLSYTYNNFKFDLDLSAYDILLLWAPTTTEKFICIEPWYGTTDFIEREDYEIKNKDFILKLEPQAKKTAEFNITFNK